MSIKSIIISGKKYSYNYNNSNEKRIDFEITPIECTNKPEYLFKYSSLNKYSVDSLKSNFLFAAHPDMFNDVYDCAPELLDYQDVNLKLILDVYKEYFNKGILNREIIETEYNTNREITLRDFGKLARDIVFGKYGIISLTEDEFNIPMWAYYGGNNTGFVTKYKASLLDKELWGPFNINYQTKINKLKFDQRSPLNFLYMTNIKFCDWRHEKEWRYIKRLDDFHIPHLSYIDKISVRNSYYNPNALMEIILGYNIFELEEYSNNSPVKFNIKLNPCFGIKRYKLLKDLLNIISIKNTCSQLKKISDKFLFSKMKYQVNKINDSEFSFENTTNQV